jgi:hypothetical protein
MGGLLLRDQSFWLICAAFYLVDNARLHAGRELLLAETISLKWVLLQPLPRYRLGGRAITLLPPWLPFLAAVRLGWLKDDPFSALALTRTKRLLFFYQRCLGPFRVLASFYFILLFVVGPVATYYAGLGYALIIAFPLHIVGLVLLVLFLTIGRRAWRMHWQQLLGLVFECAVCPGYFVNICRKISLGYVRVPGDAIAVAFDQNQDSAVQSIMMGGFDILLDDLAEHDELRCDDHQHIATYRARLSETDAHA